MCFHPSVRFVVVVVVVVENVIFLTLNVGDRESYSTFHDMLYLPRVRSRNWTKR